MEFETLYSEMDLQELEVMLWEKVPQLEVSVLDMVKEVYEGNGKGLLLMVWDNMKELCLLPLADVKKIMITLVTIILISALFSTFKDTFQNAQIAEIAFYINYLLLVVLLMNLFGNILEIGESTLRDMEEFMRIFFPTFFLFVGSTFGLGTSLAYYQIAGGVIYLVEWCLLSLILPAVSVYMLFVFMNGIWGEEKLVLLLELFQKGIRCALKILLGILTGAGILQSMIVPVIDRLKGETVSKFVEAIPGVGELAEGALRVWLGSAVLIKNSIGIVGCILLIALCLAPIVKILLMGSLLKITAAILGIAGEKKMIHCTNQVGDGIFMILQTVGCGILFFLVLISITIYATGGN